MRPPSQTFLFLTRLPPACLPLQLLSPALTSPGPAGSSNLAALSTFHQFFRQSFSKQFQMLSAPAASPSLTPSRTFVHRSLPSPTSKPKSPHPLPGPLLSPCRSSSSRCSGLHIPPHIPLPYSLRNPVPSALPPLLPQFQPLRTFLYATTLQPPAPLHTPSTPVLSWQKFHSPVSLLAPNPQYRLRPQFRLRFSNHLLGLPNPPPHLPIPAPGSLRPFP